SAVQSVAGRLHTHQSHRLVLEIGVEDAHGVRTATHAGDHVVRLAAGHLGHLLDAFLADHRLEVAHHHRIGMRAGHRTDDVEGVVHVGDPVAHGFVERILERPRTRFHRHHRGTEQLHAVHVGGLTPDVFRTHVNHAFHAVARCHRGRGHAVLAGAGFGDHPRLAHAPGEQRLANAVVHLVGAGVVEVFALEIDLCAAKQLRPALDVVVRAEVTHVTLE